MTTRTLTTPYYAERRWFFSVLSLFLILFCLYVYFISVSVVHVVARKEVEREIAHVNSRIGELEAAYIAAAQDIAPESLAQHGFLTAPAEKIYIEKANGLSLAGNAEQDGSGYTED